MPSKAASPTCSALRSGARAVGRGEVLRVLPRRSTNVDARLASGPSASPTATDTQGTF